MSIPSVSSPMAANCEMTPAEVILKIPPVLVATSMSPPKVDPGSKNI
jgi:hypothetical protein